MKNIELTDLEIAKLNGANRLVDELVRQEKEIQERLAFARNHQLDIFDMVVQFHDLDTDGVYHFDGKTLKKDEKVNNGQPAETAPKKRA